MTSDRVGLRVELTKDTMMHTAGERGVIGESGGYVGVVFDNAPKALVITHACGPIMSYVRIVEDERLPEPKQLSLFGELE